ncbi:MAG: ribosome maturation factor RimP [Clostridia bacterium]|nr:ribosome maturation factor RimP [Clostridia bacterium]
MANKIVEQASKIAEEAAKKYGLELLDVEFVTENKNRYLRVYIYKPEGVTLDDCTNVHHEINKTIDDVIEIEGEYFLEVSSPGYDRSLKSEKDFSRYMGEKISVKFFAPVNGKKVYEGKLTGYDNGFITIDIDGVEEKIEVVKTSKIKRVFE